MKKQGGFANCFGVLLIIHLLAFGTVLGQTISTVDPDEGWQGQSLNLVISGTGLNFAQGTSTLAWLEQGSTIISAQVNGIQSTQLNATLNIPETSPTGMYNLHVGQNGSSETSLGNAFEVLTALPVPESPTLITPADLSVVSQNPVQLTWTSIVGAADCQFQAAVTPTFTGIYESETVVNNSAQLVIGNNMYYWRVRARNAAGVYGSWSDTFQFSVQTTTSLDAVTPGSGYQGQTLPVTISGTNVSFDQSSSTVAFSFEMGSNVMELNTGAQVQVTPPNLEFSGTGQLSIPISIPEGLYDLVFTDATSTTYTLPQSFNVLPALPPPAGLILLEPINSAIVNSANVLFDWQELPNVSRYHLQLSVDPNFANLRFNQDNLTQTEITLNNFPSGNYFWRVRAKNLSGIWGAWSEVEDFQLSGSSILTQMNPASGYAGQEDIPVTISGINLPFNQVTTTISNYSLSQGPNVLPLTEQYQNQSSLATASLDVPLGADIGYYDLTLDYPPYTPVTLPNAFLVTEGNRFSGQVFVDMNQNQVQDPGDIPYSFISPVVADPGNVSSVIQSDGSYYGHVPSGNYSLALPEINGFIPSPSQHSVSYSGSGGMSIGNDFLLTPIPDYRDLVVSLAAQPLRQGRNRSVFISVNNVGAETESGTVTLTFEQGMTVTSSSDPNYQTNGNTVSWNYSNLTILEELQIEVELFTPISFPIGQEVDFSAEVTGQGMDQTPSDNVFTLDNQVIGPYDPNYKVVSPEGPIDPSFVSNQNYFTYTVHFQNIGNASAIDVYVLDTISEFLDIASLQFITSSHDCEVINHDNRVVEFRFDDINLPDSATNEPGSRGYFSFRIKPTSVFTINDIVLNTAYIYFDYNEAIITNTTESWIATGIAELSNSINLSINPNANDGLFQISCSCSGAYSIYNLEGKLVSEGQMEGSTYVDIRHVPDGMYLLQVQTDKEVLTRRVVKY